LVGRASLSLGGKATGGISKHIEDLSIKLTENNLEVIIWDFTLKKSYSKSNVRIEGLNYTYIILGLIYSIFSLNIIFNKSYSHLPSKDKFSISIQSWKLQEYILSNDIQVVHVHSLNRPVTHFLRLKFPNIKIIITDHGFWQKKGISKNANNPTLGKIFHNINFSTKIITISSFANAQFKVYKLPTLKNINIPNPIFLPKIPIKEVSKENIIFFNGFNRSLEIKNFELVIRALKHLSFFENYKLVAIVNNEAKTFIKSIDVNFQIEILGAQPWEVVVDLYNKSKILVVPSKSESFGLVYLESLSVGTPIVGFHETVKEFQNKIDLDI
jgi:glycosyltransferase involved in cell wall biosynthesis